MIWDGEGCTNGTDSPLPDASVATSVNLYAVYNSQGQQVNTGSQLGSWSTDLTSAYNAYATLMDSLFIFNATNLFPPNAPCVQGAITSAAEGLGLDLSVFPSASVQIVNTPDPSGGAYSETELNLTGASGTGMTAFITALCNAGFSSNNQCPSNNTPLVGTPHQDANGIPYTGNFRAPGLTNSLQVNTNATLG